MKKFVFFLFMVSVVFSCSKKTHNEPDTSNKISFASDMECIDCWKNSNTLKPGIAHSGQYASKLDSATEYSYGFAQDFKNIDLKKINKVTVKVWGYFPEPDIKAQLVVSIDSANKSKNWYGFKLEDAIKTPKQWTEVNFPVFLPPTCLPGDVLKVYVWNRDKFTFFIDDLELVME
ncbi:MAG: hypothetical protein HY958_13175 [Bacteroidia bacterium]|nr:hypothetical protein [Bacteroidia bacterium]